MTFNIYIKYSNTSCFPLRNQHVSVGPPGELQLWAPGGRVGLSDHSAGRRGQDPGAGEPTAEDGRGCPMHLHGNCVPPVFC